MRSQFVREEKKIIEQHCHSTWQYYNNMIFVRDHLISQGLQEYVNIYFIVYISSPYFFFFLSYSLRLIQKGVQPIHKVLIQDSANIATYGKNKIEFECELDDSTLSSPRLAPRKRKKDLKNHLENTIKKSKKNYVKQEDTDTEVISSVTPSPEPFTSSITAKSESSTIQTPTSIISKLPSTLTIGAVKQFSQIPSQCNETQFKRQHLQKLIRLVQSEPILYNPMKYGSELQTYLVWQDIAQCMNCSPPRKLLLQFIFVFLYICSKIQLKYFFLPNLVSGLECQRKWNGLLNIYKRNFEQKQNKQIDVDCEHNKWLFDDDMRFIEKFLSNHKKYDTSIVMFFKSVLLDYNQLTSDRQRKFKVDILSSLNELVDQYDGNENVLEKWFL